MNYYILLSVLPQDIVYYIVQIINHTNSKNIIYKYYQNTRKKLESINYISHMITLENHSGFLNNDILSKDLTEGLAIIYKSNYNREKYNREFWLCFTDLLSKKLMELTNNITMNQENQKYNPKYIILNNSINLWFKICVKHNIRVTFIRRTMPYSKVEKRVYFNSKEIREIKNFIKFLCAPRCVDSNNFILNDRDSRIVIRDTINYNSK